MMKHIKDYRLFESQTPDKSRFAVISFWLDYGEEDTSTGEVIVDLHNMGANKMLPIEWDFDYTEIMKSLCNSLRSGFGNGPYTIDQINSPEVSVAIQAAFDGIGHFADPVSVTVRAVPLQKIFRSKGFLSIIDKLLPGIGLVGWKSLAWLYVQMFYQKKDFVEALSKFKEIVDRGEGYLLRGYPWEFSLAEAEKDLIPMSAVLSGNLEELDDLIRENPMDMDLLDDYPEIKAGVLKRTGLEDISDLARAMRRGLI